MVCSLVTDRQTDRQTKKAKAKAALSGLSEFLTSAHHQGAVQFDEALTEAVHVLVYAELDSMIEITKGREIVTDYTA